MSNDVLGQVVKKLVELPLKNMLGVLYDLLEKLSGSHGEEWFEKLKKFLRGELVVKMVFPTWKVIKLGTHKNVGALTSAFADAGFCIPHWTYDIMGMCAFTLASEETLLELLTATVRQLGFTNDTRFDAICARIRELGYDLCPAEVGPQLRLQYQDQPLNEWLVIVMEAMTDSYGNLEVFYVQHRDDGQRLDLHDGYPACLFRPWDRLVFVRRKLSTNA